MQNCNFMDENKKIEKIVEYLFDNTVDNTIQWKLSNSIFNNEFEYGMEAIVDETVFSIFIILNRDGSLQNGSSIFISNKDIISGRRQVSSLQFNKIRNLEILIYDKYVKPNIKVQSTSVYDDIINSLGKDHIRNEKIEKILDDEKKSKSIFEKLFKNKSH